MNLDKIAVIFVGAGKFGSQTIRSVDRGLQLVEKARPDLRATWFAVVDPNAVARDQACRAISERKPTQFDSVSSALAAIPKGIERIFVREAGPTCMRLSVYREVHEILKKAGPRSLLFRKTART